MPTEPKEVKPPAYVYDCKYTQKQSLATLRCNVLKNDDTKTPIGIINQSQVFIPAKKSKFVPMAMEIQLKNVSTLPVVQGYNAFVKENYPDQKWAIPESNIVTREHIKDYIADTQKKFNKVMVDTLNEINNAF